MNQAIASDSKFLGGDKATWHSGKQEGDRLFEKAQTAQQAVLTPDDHRHGLTLMDRAEHVARFAKAGGLQESLWPEVLAHAEKAQVILQPAADKCAPHQPARRQCKTKQAQARSRLLGKIDVSPGRLLNRSGGRLNLPGYATAFS